MKEIFGDSSRVFMEGLMACVDPLAVYSRYFNPCTDMTLTAPGPGPGIKYCMRNCLAVL
jgi:hypothetical protein